MISSITNQGKVRFMFYEGSMNAKMFINSFADESKMLPKIHLILDNLPTHHSKVVKEWAENEKTKSSFITCPAIAQI